MPRNMSFALTTEQFKRRTKTVTRRNGWQKLKVGDIINGCEKCMGIPKGEKIKRLGQIRILKVTREPLNEITQEDVIKEGFPQWTPRRFIKFYADHNKMQEDGPVTRIEFEYLETA